MNAAVASPPPPRPGSTVLVSLVVLLAAFLLFVLELATAKALLPRFGGSPMVWTTSMLVYQLLLLAGYAYAHGLAGRRSAGLQAALHLGFLSVAVAVAFWRLRLSSLGSADPSAVTRHPVADLVWTLLGSIAIPFVAVSATSPLVQHWQQRLHPERPSYWLYAVSNAGSFAGLLAYPFLIEPMLSVKQQFAAWTVLFAALAAGLGCLALRLRGAGPAPAVDARSDAPRVRGRNIALWMLLPAGTSALLLASTNELCQDLAVFPFLWVLPLSLYLLSFSLAFRPRPARNALPAAAVATVVALATTSLSLMLPVPVHIVSIGALVFLLCLAVHRELYRLRPPAQHLTSYYLWVAAGSGLGAVGVALAAPVLFPGYWEFQLAVLATWIALTAAVALDREGCMRLGDSRHAAVLLGLGLYFALNTVPEDWLRRHVPSWPSPWSAPLRVGAAVAMAVLLWRALQGRRAIRSAVWPRLLAGLVVFIAECSALQRIRSDRSQTERVARNFFGVVRVLDVVHAKSGIRVRQLTHGRINHGFQYVNPELRGQATSYHSPSTGVGRAMRILQGRRDAIRIGVTGLGAGALAAYPRATDRIVFYEIDAQVVELSSGTGAVFSFVNDCPGQTEIVLGDARQSLQYELARQGSRRFDVLALDAFSSDAVPTHLLTREAMSLYLQHLAPPDGILAVNISNRFLDLEPVLADTAHAFGLSAVLVDSLGDPPVQARSIWVLLSRDPAVLAGPDLASVSRPLTAEQVVWTDAASSPLPLLKWWMPNTRHVRLMPPPRGQPAVSSPALLPARTPADPGD